MNEPPDVGFRAFFTSIGGWLAIVIPIVILFAALGWTFRNEFTTAQSLQQYSLHITKKTIQELQTLQEIVLTASDQSKRASLDAKEAYTILTQRLDDLYAVSDPIRRRDHDLLKRLRQLEAKLQHTDPVPSPP